MEDACSIDEKRLQPPHVVFLHDNHAHPRILIPSKRADEISEPTVNGVIVWIQFLRTEVPRFLYGKVLA